ncbi:tetratricopeptide repeat protein [Paracidobacterium acidisoli]|nr:tetratricopeptide repeat protein [Paracidobacterium acidisoli]MBT9331535.1 tetratricopeptide repeat protein [Paracidobacterium acidisoli]
MLLFGWQQSRPQSTGSEDISTWMDAARTAQQAQDYSAAASAYRKAVRLEPQVAELWANLGIMEYQAGQDQPAARDLAKALALKPSLFSANLFLGLEQLRLDAPRSALRYLSSAERLNASDPQVWIATARAYKALHDYWKATSSYRQALQIDPANSSAWLGLGMTYLAHVESDSRVLTDTAPSSGYTYALFAEMLVRQGRLLQAVSEYRSAINHADHPPCLPPALSLVYIQLGKLQDAANTLASDEDRQSECPLTDLAQAAAKAHEENYPDAVAMLNQAWSTDDGYTEANLVRALSALPSANRDRLTAELSQGAQNGSVSAKKLLAVLQGNAMQQEHQPASRTLEPGPFRESDVRRAFLRGHFSRCAELATLAERPPAPSLQLLSAECNYLSGNYSEASAELNRISSRSDAVVLYWTIKVNQYLSREALNHFQQLAPDSPETHILLGDVERQQQRYDIAISEYKVALAKSPKDSAALEGLAAAYFMNSNLSEAIETAKTALTIWPNNPEVSLVLGEALLSQHNYDAAESPLLQALNGKPQTLPHVHALLGRVCEAQSRDEEAITHLKLALSSDEDGSIHYQLARLYRKRGNKAEADKMLARTLQLEAESRAHAVVAFQKGTTVHDPER